MNEPIAERKRQWAREKYAALCPVQNAIAVQTIDAVVAEYKANGGVSATALFNRLADEQKLVHWVRLALTDIIRGLCL